MQRILVVTPMMREPDGRTRLYGRALGSIFSLRWPGQLDYFQIVGGDDFNAPDKTVTLKYAEARLTVLEGGWDAMLCAEHDMILPSDALQKLAALDADVAYGLYVFRHGKKQWNAWTRLDERSGTSISDDPAKARAAWGTAQPVAGVGMGCTLIKRHVIEVLPFRFWRGVCCDWALGCDAQASGFSQVADLSVVCGHMSLLPQPQILWPDVNDPDLYRVERI